MSTVKSLKISEPTFLSATNIHFRMTRDGKVTYEFPKLGDSKGNKNEVHTLKKEFVRTHNK